MCQRMISTMEQNKVELLIKRRIRAQKNSDRMLKMFIAVFIIGNLFFFTSLLTLPRVYKDITPSETGDTLQLGDQNISFVSWGYSKKDRLFEVVLEVEDLSLQGKPDIAFNCWSGNNYCSISNIEIVDDSLYAIYIKKVPRRFYTASLGVRTTNAEGSEASGAFYATNKSVCEISSATTDKEYLIFAADVKIKSYKSRIRTLNSEQEKLRGQIENSVETIESLEKSKRTQTEAEQEETEGDISRVAAEAEQIQSEIEDNARIIEELDEKIRMQEKIINELKGGDQS